MEAKKQKHITEEIKEEIFFLNTWRQMKILQSKIWGMQQGNSEREVYSNTSPCQETRKI